jgi:hypothetical protein
MGGTISIALSYTMWKESKVRVDSEERSEKESLLPERKAIEDRIKK